MPQSIKEVKKIQREENAKYLKEVEEKIKLQNEGKEVPQELQHVEVPSSTPHVENADASMGSDLGFGGFVLFSTAIVAAFLAKKVKKSRKKTNSISDRRMEELLVALSDHSSSDARMEKLQSNIESEKERQKELLEKVDALLNKK